MCYIVKENLPWLVSQSAGHKTHKKTLINYVYYCVIVMYSKITHETFNDHFRELQTITGTV